MKTVRATCMLVGLVVALLAGARSAGAQTWQWHVAVQPPGGRPVDAQSRVVLSRTDLTMSYSVQVQQRQVPIASCRAELGDVASAKVVQKDGRSFLLVVLKPQTSATCDSGRQPVAMVPVADSTAGTRVAAAITQVCCMPVVAAARPAPSSAPSPVPSRVPSPIPSSASPPKTPKQLTDWVETEGLFTFIRVRNRFSEPVTIDNGAVSDCRNVEYGCGPFPNGSVTVPPGSAVTIATVMSGERGDAAFTYRYGTQGGRYSGSGSSGKVPVGWRPRMSAQDVRLAVASAVASSRTRPAAGQPASPAQTPAPVTAGARLIRRGSSRLGIGQTGIARVRVSVGANGMPQDASIVSISNRQLVAAALETAVSSTYTPAMRDGHPIPGQYVATFQFDGQDPATAAIPVWRRDPTPAPSPSE